METSDLSEAAPVSREGWRSAITMNGPQCAMTSGAMLMLKWSADSSDTQQLVGNYTYWELPGL